MDTQLSEEQIQLIERVAEEERFVDYELETTSGSLKGDGYMGVITTVTIKNNSKKLDLVLKTAQPSEIFRKTAPIRASYLREIYLYSVIFPEFKKFQEENGNLEGFSGHAKFYGGGDKEYSEWLLLENIKEKGFKLWNRKVPMNSDHVALVFTEYAKFHAVSLAMRHKQPGNYNKLTENLTNVFDTVVSPESWSSHVQSVFENAFKAVENNSFATEALKRISSRGEKLFSEDLKPPDDICVVTHSDCWCNNMMFKYENYSDQAKPTKVCLLDWQVSQKGSPLLDLTYFFYVCSSKEILHDYKKYLKIYHDTVTEQLKSMSCDAEEIFPYNLLEQHWKKYSWFGMYMALIITRIMMSDSEEAPDYVEKTEAGQSFMEGVNFNLKAINNYYQRLNDIIVFIVEHDFI